MKKLVSIIFLLIIIASCSTTTENQMRLTGTINGLKKGTVILERIGDSSLETIDSIVVNGDPNFIFTTEISSPEMYYLYLRLKSGELLDDRIPFFAEPSEINITASLENFGNDQVITGSANQDKANEYAKVMQRYSNKNLDLIKSEIEANKDNQDSLVSVFQKQRQSLINSRYLAAINFAKNNNDFELAPYILLTDVADANVKLLDTVYTALTPKIKDSKYGKVLESLIQKRKE